MATWAALPGSYFTLRYGCCSGEGLRVPHWGMLTCGHSQSFLRGRVKKQPKESVRQSVRKGDGMGERGRRALCPREGRPRRPGGHGASSPAGPATLGRSPGAPGPAAAAGAGPGGR